MAERSFAPWVEPVAAALAADRRTTIAFARSAPAGLWARPSSVAGWTYQDILAHLAGGNDLMLQRILHSAVNGASRSIRHCSASIPMKRTRAASWSGAAGRWMR